MASYGLMLTREELDYLNRLLKYEEIRFGMASQIREKVKPLKQVADEDYKSFRRGNAEA